MPRCSPKSPLVVKYDYISNWLAMLYQCNVCSFHRNTKNSYTFCCQGTAQIMTHFKSQYYISPAKMQINIKSAFRRRRNRVVIAKERLEWCHTFLWLRDVRLTECTQAECTFFMKMPKVEEYIIRSWPSYLIMSPDFLFLCSKPQHSESCMMVSVK